MADALKSVPSNNTRRVYAAQWRFFTGWCDEMDLRSMPAEPVTVARYLAVHSGDGASIAALRLAKSATSSVMTATLARWPDRPWPTCTGRGGST